MARPRIYDAEIIAEQLHDYIDKTDDPQLAEFTLPRDMPCVDTINELGKSCKALSDAVKRLHQKQQVFLTSCKGDLPFPMAIFRLKQPIHGFRDKFEIESDSKISVDFNLPDNIKQLSK